MDDDTFEVPGSLSKCDLPLPKVEYVETRRETEAYPSDNNILPNDFNSI